MKNVKTLLLGALLAATATTAMAERIDRVEMIDSMEDFTSEHVKVQVWNQRENRVVLPARLVSIDAVTSTSFCLTQLSTGITECSNGFKAKRRFIPSNSETLIVEGEEYDVTVTYWDSLKGDTAEKTVRTTAYNVYKTRDENISRRRARARLKLEIARIDIEIAELADQKNNIRANGDYSSSTRKTKLAEVTREVDELKSEKASLANIRSRI